MALSWALHSAVALSVIPFCVYRGRGCWEASGRRWEGESGEEAARSRPAPPSAGFALGRGDQPHTTEVPTATHAAETWFLFRSLLLSLGF